jgi:ABC-2 type transport system ATP-binding protein
MAITARRDQRAVGPSLDQRATRLETGLPAIVVEGLRKHYGDFEAVRGISFTVPRGVVFGLLGPNGAGKTTTVEILEGHRRRSAGTVSVLGEDPEHGGRRLRERLGIVLQSAGFDAELTVDETVRLYGSFYPHARSAHEVVTLVGMDEKRRARVRTLSGGQRRRLDLALALVGNPELIFLDEPTTGFDPNARRRAWDTIDRLRALGTTIVLTSHYLDEVQRLADHVVVLSGGQIVGEGTPSSLGGRDIAEAEILFRLAPPLHWSDLPRAVRRVAERRDGEVVIHTDAPTHVLHLLTAWADAEHVELEALRVVRPSLEDVYLGLTKDAEEQVRPRRADPRCCGWWRARCATRRSSCCAHRVVPSSPWWCRSWCWRRSTSCRADRCSARAATSVFPSSSRRRWSPLR